MLEQTTISSASPLVGHAQYAVALIEPSAREILVRPRANGWSLPTVSIPQGARACVRFREVAKSEWRVTAHVLEFAIDGDCPSLIVAEAQDIGQQSGLAPVPLSALASSELSRSQQASIEHLLWVDDASVIVPGRLGWLEQAVEWVETTTNSRLLTTGDVLQLNAGHGFALLRFAMADGSKYWLKATGFPNAHEYEITRYLSGSADSLSAQKRPISRLIALKPEWNAWLMEDAGPSISEQLEDTNGSSIALQSSLSGLLRLQRMTIGKSECLLQAGAFDQRWAIWSALRGELFEHIIEAMAQQTSTKVPSVSAERLRMVQELFALACDEVENLGLPATVVHGDLSRNNILVGSSCHFVDWSEAYLGCPLANFAHILMLNRAQDPQLHMGLNKSLAHAYCDGWSDWVDPKRLAEALKYAPMIGAFSALHGRGDWLDTADRNDPRRLAYSRTLGRYLDRAAQDLEAGDSSCL